MKKNGTPNAETTVKHVKIYGMFDADTMDKIIKLNGVLDTCLDGSSLLIPSMGNVNPNYYGFQSPQWDPVYGENTPTDAEYRSMEKKYLLDPKYDRRADAIGGISKPIRGMHVHAREVKTREN